MATLPMMRMTEGLKQPLQTMKKIHLFRNLRTVLVLVKVWQPLPLTVFWIDRC